MKILAIIRKALIMQMRDFGALLLTILSAPFFILVYYAMTSGGSTTYSVLYHDADRNGSVEIRKQLMDELNAVTYNSGEKSLILTETQDTAAAKTLIKNRKADVLLVIPEGFSDSLKTAHAPNFQVYGEASNPKYSIGLIFSITGLESMVRKYSQNKPLYTFDEKFMGNSLAKSEFDIYVPGIFIFSIIMLILSASLSIIRDVEDKTMLRLKLTRMTVLDYLVGNTLVQWLVGIISFGITLWLAKALGFNSAGSLWLVLLVCSLTILSVIAISLILVAFCKNATMVMIVGNFPLFILMFFTGSMLPLPRHEIFTGFALNDLLPPTHAVIAMNKIFTYGSSLNDISYELIMLSVLTVVYYLLGVVLFRKRHLNII
jgi:ABC-2 type transport system permease protein